MVTRELKWDECNNKKRVGKTNEKNERKGKEGINERGQTWGSSNSSDVLLNIKFFAREKPLIIFAISMDLTNEPTDRPTYENHPVS